MLKTTLKEVGARAARILDMLRSPDDPDRKEAVERVWETLPDALRFPDQALGRQAAGCAATHNVLERCNFSCTACYLANTGNLVPPLPFEEVKAQLDEIRDYLGPGGNTQITAGEVTLLPVEELSRIVRYSRELGLSAMVMTHGETLRDDPDYLAGLVEAGLEKVAIHIDTTQRGRRGLEKTDTEADIHWIRDEFANLIRRTRRKTGMHLAASHTFTVTEENLDGVPDVMDWILSNTDAFRLISFQPTAEVGRTRENALAGRKGRREAFWDKVCEGVGAELNPNTFFFGHPRCNQISLMWVVEFDGERHVVEVVRKDEAVDRLFFRRLIHGSFAGFNPDNLDVIDASFLLMGKLMRQPQYFAEVPLYCAYRAFTERAWFPRLLAAIAAGRTWSVNPFVIVVHHFMSSDELETAEGRERLEACAFRLPIDGEMVSMCQVNGTDLRQKLNVETTERLAPGSYSARAAAKLAKRDEKRRKHEKIASAPEQDKLSS